jgi:hypothetical protein
MSSSLIFQAIRNAENQLLLTANHNWAADPYIRQQIRHEASPDSHTQHWLQRWHPNHSAKFINRATGLVIDAIGGHLSDHAQLQQYVDTGNPNQQWNGAEADVNSFNMFASNTNEVWDVPNGSRDPGTVIQLFQFNGREYQAWKFDPVVVEQTFQIRCREGQLVLDVPGFSVDDATPIQQYDDNGGLNQVWQVQDVSSGLSKIISVSSGKLLDAPLQATNQPADISQYGDNGGDNQLWRLEPLANGFTKIVPVLSPDFALDVPNGSHDRGVHVQQYRAHGGFNQQWELIPVTS